MRRLLVLLVVLATGVLGRSAYATTVEPSAANLQILPGESVSQEITVTNDTGGVVTYSFSTQAVSFGESADDLTLSEPPADLARWLSFAPAELTLGSGGRDKVVVTISPPVGTTSDVYPLAVVITEQAREVGGVAIQNGVASLLFISVGEGLEPRLKLEGFATLVEENTGRPTSVIATLSNEGNGLAQPIVEAAIRHPLGFVAHRLSLNPTGRRIPPGTTRSFSADWPYTGWELGPYQVTLYLSQAPDQTLTVSQRVVLFSWRTATLLALIVLALATLFWFWRRSR